MRTENHKPSAIAPKVAVGAWVDISTDKAVREIAKSQGRTRSQVIQDAIVRYVTQVRRKKAA